MNRDTAKQKPHLRVIKGSGLVHAATRIETTPLTMLRRNPVTKLCERFATHPEGADEQVVRLLRIVGTNGKYGIEDELKGRVPHKSVHLHHETEPHRLAGYLHKEFARARLMGVRDLLSDPAQSLYDELLCASSTAWASAASITKPHHWIDPFTKDRCVTFKIYTKLLSLDFPPRHPDRDTAHLPLVLEGHMQGHLNRGKENLQLKMARHADGYTPNQAARDRHILSELVLPTITFYPPTRGSFLSDPKTYDDVERFLYGVLDENRNLAQRKTWAAARYPAGPVTPASRPSAQVVPLRARPSGPESPT